MRDETERAIERESWESQVNKNRRSPFLSPEVN